MTIAPDAAIHFYIEDGMLHVKNEHAQTKASGLKGILIKCCSTQKPFSDRAVPLFDILWAQHEDHQICIDYIRRRNKKRPVKRLLIDCPVPTQCDAFVSSLLKDTYRDGYVPPRVKVLLNPIGGTGKAASIWQHTVSHILRAARFQVDFQATEYAGHASDIAEQLDVSQFDAVWCISGDGLPHEVINGLGRRKDAMRALQLPIGAVPAGSGNGTAKSVHNTNEPITCTLGLIKGFITPVDLLHVTQGDRSYLSYFSTSYGVIAESDIGTDHLRWMGEIRFEVGALQRILTRTAYPCDLALSVVTDDKQKIRANFHARRGESTGEIETWQGPGLPPLRYGTINDPVPATWQNRSYPNMGTFFAGFFPYVSSTACFCPPAVPASGEIDILYLLSDMPLLSALSTMSAVDKGKHYDSKHCYYAKCDAFRLSPKKPSGCLSIDGERYPFEPFQGEVVRSLARIITRDGQYFTHFGDD